MPSCQTCGAPLPASARFCSACGAAAALVVEAGSRRPVTIVFTDVVGSTALGERLDAETLGLLMTRYYEVMREAVERHGGSVEKFIGDAVVATFGTPDVHEDDALRAVRAACEMHDALEASNDEFERRWGVRLEMRTGVTTGEVLAGVGAAVLGSPANLAARLQAEAGGGEILLSGDTHRIVRDHVRAEPAGALELKGFEEPVECFRLVSLDGAAPSRERTPHVGRDQELTLLSLAFRRAARDRRTQLVTVLGDPGIGKTRLVDEAVASFEGDLVVLRGRCLPYGEGITFFPVGEAVSSAASIDRDDDAQRAKAKVAAMVPHEAASIAARVSEAIGLGGPGGAPEETLWAIRRYFELLAAERPSVLVFDDLQWAEPTFLDLVEQLVEHGRGVAQLVITMARPELLEVRPAWAGGVANAVTISLEPLDRDEGSLLARHVTAGGELDDDLAAWLVGAAGGNPFFLEEFIAMLVHDGTLVERDGRWMAAADLAAATSTPPTLLGLLTARLHRLPRDEQDALVHASVIGKAFSLDELAALGDQPLEETETVVRHLLARDLLRMPSGASLDGPEVEFQHQLLRDAAYGSLPKTRRADLHERFAGHLEGVAAERPEELDEIVGHHLARAYYYRTELGAVGEVTRPLAERAAARLSAAGGRAVERGDPRAAIRLLRRAVSLATEPGPRATMRLRLCHALADVAEGQTYEATMLAGLEDAIAAGDERLRTRFEHMRTAFALVVATKDTPLDTVTAELRSQSETLGELGDAEGVAECLYQLATTAWIRGDAAGFERAARDALDAATASGNGRLVGRTATYVILALLRGTTPLSDALAESRAIRRDTALSVSASASLRLGEVEMLTYLGRSDEAADLLEAASADLSELGLRLELAVADTVRAIVGDARGDLDEAERRLRRSYERFRDGGDAANSGVIAVDLADVLARMGRYDEALEMAEVAAELAADVDVEAQVGWRMAAAQVRAAQGDGETAMRLLGDAMDRLETTDLVLLRADTLRSSAEVFAALGRSNDAIERLEAASAIYAAKGHVMGERDARQRSEMLSAGQLP